jgi:hypothetical protein
MKWCVTHSQHASIVWKKKSSKTKTARTYAPTKYYEPESLLQSSQEQATGPYPEPDESSHVTPSYF